MPTRRSLLLVSPGILLGGLVLAGCGHSPQEESSSSGNSPAGSAPRGQNAPGSSPASGKPFLVALVTNGSLADSGWNSLAGKGLEQIKSELHAETKYQSSTESGGEGALRGFAQDGARLVFAHGGEFQDAAKRVAADNPDTIFVVSSGEVQGPNLASLRFDLGEAGYLAGMVAASLSKTGKAGQIGGTSMAPVKKAFELFEKGGKTVNPAFTTTTTYLGSWDDATAGKEKALAMIRAGADVLFQNADAAGQGVFQAAKEHPGTLVIGSNANQNDLMPDVIPASAVLDVAKTFVSVARDVQSGKFQGRIYLEDLKSGNVYLAINPAFQDRIPESVRKKIAQMEQDIQAGKLSLIGGK